MISFTDYLSYGKNSVLNSINKYICYNGKKHLDVCNLISDMISFKNELINKDVDITLLPDYIQYCDKAEFIFPDTNFMIPVSDFIKFDVRNGKVEIKDGQINFSISLRNSVEVEDIYGFKRVAKYRNFTIKKYKWNPETCEKIEDCNIVHQIKYGYFDNIFEVKCLFDNFLLNKAIHNCLQHLDKDIKRKYSIRFNHYNFRKLKEKFRRISDLYNNSNNIENFIKIINHKDLFNEIMEERDFDTSGDSIRNLLHEIQRRNNIEKNKTTSKDNKKETKIGDKKKI